MDFTPATFKFGNPLEDTNNALNTVLMMEKVTDNRAKRRKGEARNSLMQMPGVMKGDGTIDRPTLRTSAVKGGYGEFLPEWEEQWAKDDENVAQTAHINAQVGQVQAATSKTQGEDIAKRLETTSKMLGLIQTPQQYVEFITKDPILGEALTKRGMGPDQLMASLNTMNPEQFQRFLVEQRVGADKALQNHYVTANRGGTGGIYQMPQYGAGAPKEVANWKVTENPNSIPRHWVQDVVPGTNQVINKVVNPGEITNIKPLAPTPEEKAITKEMAERTKAASIVATEIRKLGGGTAIVHPETGDIEIKGAMPLSPVAERRMDAVAGELGGRLEMVPGQNPRIVLDPGTTIGQVQSILRQKNNLVWEQGSNQVKRLVEKKPGVIQMPAEPKKESPVKLRQKALSLALQWAKTEMVFDQMRIDKKEEEYYQELLRTPGAGYGGQNAYDRFEQKMGGK